MAKKKKKYVAHSPKKGFGLNLQNLKAGIRKAQKFLALRELDKALTKLRELDDRYPDRPEVLKYLAYTYNELGISSLYQFTLERWIEVAPDDRFAFLSLGAAYLEQERPSLALETFKLIRDKFPDSEDRSDIKKTIATLEEAIAEIIKELDLEVGDRPRELLLLHEKSMSALAINNFVATRQYIEQLLAIEPHFAGALNNLSFAYWFDNQYEEAISVTERCLAANPDSYHAISNYIAYRVWLGRPEGLETYAEQLKETRDRWQTDPNYWLKAAEAFSWLEDDESLFALYQMAKDSDRLEQLTGIFYHYLAAAHLRQKQEQEARSFWEKSLKKNPNLGIARDNLEDLKQAAGTHHSPWSFPNERWLLGNMRKGITKAFEGTGEDEEKLAAAAQVCLEKYPELNTLIPLILHRGDPDSRILALMLAKYMKTPNLLEVLRQFALSDIGPDAMRHEAGYIASQAGLMPAGKTKMWIQGKWQEILLIGIELHNDMVDEHSPKTSKLLTQGIMELKAGNAEKAEELLKQALKLNPDARDLNYNLAIAYQLQKRDREAEELCQKIYDRDPNYPFARIALAKYHLDREELEPAEELIRPMIQWKSMNYLAFYFLCQTNIELNLARKEPDGARSWLGIWKQVDPENANLEYWQARIDHPRGIIDELLEDDF